MKHLLLTLAFSTLISTGAFSQALVGQNAPNFTHTSLENEIEISLSDYRGKVVYLFLYGAKCFHCYHNGELTETDIYQSFKDDTNFVALGLDTWNESKTANESFKSRANISYTLLLNAQETLVDYYGDEFAYDRSVVISAGGSLAYKGTDLSDTDIDEVTEKIQEELSKVTTSSAPEEAVPTSISLKQNYPNPFNPSTVIRYTLNEPSQVSLKIFNMLGAEVATLVNERQPAGVKEVTWKALDSSNSLVPSGLYIYQLKAGNQVLTKKMTLIK